MNMKRTMHLVFVIALFSCLSCQKKVTQVVVPPGEAYTGSIKSVLQYNPAEFSKFYAALQKFGLADTLSSPGPFTLIALDNGTGNIDYYNDSAAVYEPYVLPGLFPLKAMSPGETTIINGSNGYRILAACYAVNGDTSYTLNGIMAGKADQQATNGLIDVLDRAMWPFYYPSPLYYIQSNPDLSIFAYALQRSGMDTLLADSTKTYTVLAPSNEAMLSAGISLDYLAAAGPDSLAANFVGYYIIPGRNFIYDFIIQYEQEGVVSIPTLAGTPINGLVYPGVLYYMQFFANPNSNPANVLLSQYSDVPAGLSVVQGIDAVLVP